MSTTVTLTPVFDGGMGSGSPTGDRSTLNQYRVGELASTTGRNRATAQFDFSSIPVNAVIVSATMRLWDYNVDASQGDTLVVYRFKRAWTDTCNWNTYDGTHAWATAGAFDSTDCDISNYVGSATIGATTLSGWLDVPMTPTYVQDIVAGTWVNNGYLLKTLNENNDMHYYQSMEGVHPPQLVITYALPATGQFQVIFFG